MAVTERGDVPSQDRRAAGPLTAGPNSGKVNVSLEVPNSPVSSTLRPSETASRADGQLLESILTLSGQKLTTIEPTAPLDSPSISLVTPDAVPTGEVVAPRGTIVRRRARRLLGVLDAVGIAVSFLIGAILLAVGGGPGTVESGHHIGF